MSLSSWEPSWCIGVTCESTDAESRVKVDPPLIRLWAITGGGDGGEMRTSRRQGALRPSQECCWVSTCSVPPAGFVSAHTDAALIRPAWSWSVRHVWITKEEQHTYISLSRNVKGLVEQNEADSVLKLTTERHENGSWLCSLWRVFSTFSVHAVLPCRSTNMKETREVIKESCCCSSSTSSSTSTLLLWHLMKVNKENWAAAGSGDSSSSFKCKATPHLLLQHFSKPPKQQKEKRIPVCF